MGFFTFAAKSGNDMRWKYEIGNLLGVIILLLAGLGGMAQDETLKELQEKALEVKKMPGRDSGKIWTVGGRYLLNVAQGSQSNWAAGGDEFSFSLNTNFGFFARYQEGGISWDNAIDLNYGIMNNTSQGTRKTDDRMDITTKPGYSITPTVNLATLFNFHSQFTKGYNYKSDGTRELLSNFMSPGYFLVSIGFDYRPSEGLSIFLSPITSRWVYVANDSLAAQGAYGVDSGQHVTNEIGAFASINYNKDFSKKISYSGRLDLFSNYKNNPQNIDLLMTNMLIAKISKIFSFNVSLNLIYDDDVKLFGKNNDSPALQIKQTFGAGVAVKF